MTYPVNRRYLGTVGAPGVEGGIPVAINPAILASNTQLLRVMNALNTPANDAEKRANDPSTTSAAYDRMLWRIFLMESVLGGTETMRAAGKVLMPMYTAEKQSDWETRLSQAVLFNYAERTASDLSNRLFKTPPKLPTVEEGLDTLMPKHFEDVDGGGTSMIDFMREWFQRSFELGFYSVIVNTPKKDSTTAVDRKTPTWSFIHNDNIIFAHEKTLSDGTIIVDHMRIMESVVEMDGFAEVTVRKIRVLEVGKTSVYKENPKPAPNDPAWILEDTWDTEWDRVPVVTNYTNKIGFMEAIPPLQDLAYLNARHWQSYSDQTSILTVSRFPLLVATGTSSGRGSQTISPRKMFKIPDPKGKLAYVEHTGAAIRSGQDDLEMLEGMMANYGSEFLKSRPGSTAATSRSLDSAESTSMLTTMASSFEDSVHELLVMTMRGFESFDAAKLVPRVELVVDLSVSATDSTELTTLDLARRRHDISRKQYVGELARRDILADTFNADADWLQIQAEVKIEREMGLLKDENEGAIPTVENAQDRAASGKSSRDKPDNGKGSTGEEEQAKDEQL